jgi:hypothetical protein
MCNCPFPIPPRVSSLPPSRRQLPKENAPNNNTVTDRTTGKAPDLHPKGSEQSPCCSPPDLPLRPVAGPSKTAQAHTCGQNVNTVQTPSQHSSHHPQQHTQTPFTIDGDQDEAEADRQLMAIPEQVPHNLTWHKRIRNAERKPQLVHFVPPEPLTAAIYDVRVDGGNTPIVPVQGQGLPSVAMHMRQGRGST